MKTSIILSLCLALLIQSSIAQNEDPSTEPTALPPTTPTPAQPSPPAEPVTEPSTSPEPPSTPPTPPSTPPTPPTPPPTPAPEASTEASTINTPVESTTPVPSNKTNINIVEKLSDQIRSILKHFHEPEPTGFPGQVILPDPMPAPNTTSDLGVGTGHFYNLNVHGLSNFTVQDVNLLLDEMQVYVMIYIKKVFIKGNLTIETMFTTSKGPFNMTLSNVTAEGTVYLKADSTGKLYADKSTSDMHYQELSVGSTSSSLFQSAVNAAGMMLLASIRPHILNQIDKRLNEEVNKQLELSPKIPKIVNRSPVDLAIMEGRKFVREQYEPLTIQNVLSHDSEHLLVNIGPVTIKGLSKFARVGNITVQMKQGVVQLIARFITGKLKGDCKFYYDFGKVGVTRNGTTKFDIDHLQFEAKLNQSINLRNKPILDDLQLEVGKIRVQMDGTGDFDFLVDMVVQFIPDMLRHLIVDTLEQPIKEKLQSEILDKINVEQAVEDHLPLVESFFVY